MKYETKVKLVILTIVLTLCVCGGGFYVDDYYKAEDIALEVMQSSDDIKVVQEDNTLSFIPNNPTKGFIFYPGGKVEYSAYNALLYSLAQNDILCVVVKMPLNLAVLDNDAAKNIPALYPEIEHWYMGGHSLGGSIAATYLEKQNDFDCEGLVLLASYSTSNLNTSSSMHFNSNSLDVLSIYGSEDTVLNKEKYEKYYSNLPSDTKEICIEGGNHAQFGNYGFQKGDQKATISSKEQQEITISAILDFINETSR